MTARPVSFTPSSTKTRSASTGRPISFRCVTTRYASEHSKIAVDVPTLEAEFQRSRAKAEAEKASRIAHSEAKLAEAAAEPTGSRPPMAQDISASGGTAAAVEFLESAIHEISAAGTAQDSVDGRLAKLQRLRDGGVLSTEEYGSHRVHIDARSPRNTKLSGSGFCNRCKGTSQPAQAPRRQRSRPYRVKEPELRRRRVRRLPGHDLHPGARGGTAAAAPLVCGLLSEIRRATYLAHRQGTLRGQMLFALDEAANIAPVEELPAIASEGGGQGLTLLAVFQDLY